MNLNVENDQSGLLRLPNLRVKNHWVEDGKTVILVESVKPFVKTPCCLWGMKKNGTKTIRYRDFGVQKQETWLEIRRQRFICDLCGKTHYEPLPDLDNEFRITKRFRQQIEKDAVDDTFVKTAKDNAVEVTTVKRIFHKYAKAAMDGYKPIMPMVLGMDEKWLFRGPRFVISDIENSRILDMSESRKNQDLGVYFDGLSGRSDVEIVCQDMWRGYRTLTKTYFPNARTVIDKFHVVRYADIGVGIVRKAIARDVEKKERIRLKSSISLLKVRWQKAGDPEKKRLNELFADYPKLGEAYFVKERFYDIYLCQTRAEASKELSEWTEDIPNDMLRAFLPAITAAKNWRPWILNYFEYRYTSGVVERLNGLIAKMNTNASGLDFETIRAKMLLKYGRFQDERQELRYSHDPRNRSTSEFCRVERKLIEVQFLDRPEMTGRILGSGMDLSTLEAAFGREWL